MISRNDKNVFLVLIFFQPFIVAGQTAQITYLGNMGCLIKVGEKKIIVDGLHQKYKADYLYPTEDLAEQIIQGKNPAFAGIDALCVSHGHRDHYSPLLSIDFLRKNNEAILVLPGQAEDSLLPFRNYESIRKRILTPRPAKNVPDTINGNGFEILALDILHINQKRHHAVKNLGYLVSCNGIRIFHAGDSDMDIKMYEGLGLSKFQIDIAIIPDWMLLSAEGIEIINQQIQPKKLIATHISPLVNKVEWQKALHNNFPEAALFTELLQQTNYSR